MAATSSTPFPLGVFVGNPDIDNVSAEALFDASNRTFDSLMGAVPIYMNTYIDFTQPISDWLGNAGWAAASSQASATFKGEIPVIGLPMNSTAAGSLSNDQSYKNFAAGDYDSMLQAMVKTWANDGFMTQYWRPGLEMNTGKASFGGTTTAQRADWIAAFQHIYTVLHAAANADGVKLKVIWNPDTTNDSGAGNPTTTLYPGNQYVDIIAIDSYGTVFPYGTNSHLYDWDKSGQVLNSPNPVYDSSVTQWASDPINLEHYYTYPASDQWSLDASGGSALSLPQIIAFAKAQGKPIAVAETGAGNTDDGAGLSDNPTFVQWLSSTLDSAGVTIDYVSVWDSGGNYEFTKPSDDRPLEAAAWAKYFGDPNPQTLPITVTPASEAVTSTNGASVNPFQNIAINDLNASQTETATVTLSATANGKLSDPNAPADGSKIVGGVLTLSGSSTHVAHLLDALKFNPSANQIPPGGSVTTNLTAAIRDTLGQTASASSTVTASQVAASARAVDAASAVRSSGDAGTFLLAGDWDSGISESNGFMNDADDGVPKTTLADSLTLSLSEKPWNGQAEFAVYLDGRPVTVPQAVTALHEARETQSFSFAGNFGAGTHSLKIGLVNPVSGRSGSEERYLYVNGVTLNGSDVFSGIRALDSNGFSVFTITTSH